MFEWQKNDELMDTVIQMVLGDALLCPVQQWTATVKRIHGYPGAMDDRPVSTVWRYNRMDQVISEIIMNALE